MSTRESRQFKTVCFAIEGMSSFSVSLYSYYIYFFMRDTEKELMPSMAKQTVLN